MDFIIINGEILKKTEIETIPFFWNEPFVITHKFWFGYGGIPLFSENLEKLLLTLNTLNAEIPELLKNEHELFRIIKRMLNKSRFFRSGIITFQAFISQNETNTLISSLAFPEFDFPISKQGLIINFSEFEKYSGNPLNHFAFSNASNWKFADARIKDTGFNNSIFVNEGDNICECISANIFLIKGKTLFTPSTETGCYTDIIRSHILKVALKANLKASESENIKKDEVIQMNEIFIASEERGIQWVLGVGNKRFVHNYSVKIHGLLNDHLKNLIK